MSPELCIYICGDRAHMAARLFTVAARNIGKRAIIFSDGAEKGMDDLSALWSDLSPDDICSSLEDESGVPMLRADLSGDMFGRYPDIWNHLCGFYSIHCVTNNDHLLGHQWKGRLHAAVFASALSRPCAHLEEVLLHFSELEVPRRRIFVMACGGRIAANLLASFSARLEVRCCSALGGDAVSSTGKLLEEIWRARFSDTPVNDECDPDSANADTLLESRWRHLERLCSEIFDCLQKWWQQQEHHRDLGFAERKSKFLLRIRNAVQEYGDSQLQGVSRERLMQRLSDEAFGYGMLARFFRIPNISEIIVNPDGCICVELSGSIRVLPIRFSNREQLQRVIEKLLAASGRRVDELHPAVDARLPDGSRVHVLLPPLSVGGPAVTIRRFCGGHRTLADAVASGMLSGEAANLLSSCIHNRKNVLICGATGSGKTTLLGMLASLIPAEQRILTIEDAAELNIQHPHVVRLEARLPNIEGQGAVTIRDLLRHALRMRPDRIIVGECRGSEALDMLQAMNTGHVGSLTTLHANSARDALLRLETMVLLAGLPLHLMAVRTYIAACVDVVIHLERDAAGKRRIHEVCEICGMDGDQIVMEERCPSS